MPANDIDPVTSGISEKVDDLSEKLSRKVLHEPMDTSQKECLVNSEQQDTESKQVETPQKQNTQPLKKHLCSHKNCGKSFGKKSRLLIHETTHTGERPFKCEYEGCDATYPRKAHLNRHITSAHNLEEAVNFKVSCDLCPNKYSSVYALRKHMKVHQQGRLSCPECGKVFRKQSHLTTHTFVHTGLKPYKCEFAGCGMRFEVSSKLKKHSEKHIPNRFKCPHDQCTQSFSRFVDYRKHSRAHPKECTTCGKTFTHIGMLKSHLRTHAEVRDAFFCPYPVCNRYYFDEKNLRSHITVSHDQNFQGFPCDICQLSLVSKQKLREHSKVHGEDYQRNYGTSKPRKQRKDKGASKTNVYHQLPGFLDSMAVEKQCEVRISEGPSTMPSGTDESDLDTEMIDVLSLKFDKVAPAISDQ